jgi:hypothetical protein
MIAFNSLAIERMHQQGDIYLRPLINLAALAQAVLPLRKSGS